MDHGAGVIHFFQRMTKSDDKLQVGALFALLRVNQRLLSRILCAEI